MPGDAFHVADDEDLHEIEPTTSPRLLRTSTSRNSSMPKTWASAGRERAVAPSSTLKRPRVGAVRDAESPSAPPLANQPGPRAHQLGVGGAACRRRARAAPPSPRGSAAASAGTPRTSARAAARTSARRSRRSPISASPTSAATRCWSGWSSDAVGMKRPAVRAAGREHARRACRSSCGRASRPAALPAGRSRGRRPSRLRARAACAPRRAARARPDATRTRSRARRRRGRRSPRASGIAWTGFERRAEESSGSRRRTRRRQSSARGRGAPPRPHRLAARLP